MCLPCSVACTLSAACAASLRAQVGCLHSVDCTHPSCIYEYYKYQCHHVLSLHPISTVTVCRSCTDVARQFLGHTHSLRPASCLESGGEPLKPSKSAYKALLCDVQQSVGHVILMLHLLCTGPPRQSLGHADPHTAASRLMPGPVPLLRQASGSLREPQHSGHIGLQQSFGHATLEELRAASEKFANDRDWEKFHSPRNLLFALVGACCINESISPSLSQPVNQSVNQGEEICSASTKS